MVLSLYGRFSGPCWCEKAHIVRSFLDETRRLLKPKGSFLAYASRWELTLCRWRTHVPFGSRHSELLVHSCVGGGRCFDQAYRAALVSLSTRNYKYSMHAASMPVRSPKDWINEAILSSTAIQQKSVQRGYLMNSKSVLVTRGILRIGRAIALQCHELATKLLQLVELNQSTYLKRLGGALWMSHQTIALSRHLANWASKRWF